MPEQPNTGSSRSGSPLRKLECVQPLALAWLLAPYERRCCRVSVALHTTERRLAGLPS